MKLTDKQKAVLGTGGHLLVTGGPGSGKTTISILKAAQIAEKDLLPGQKILFLSFARATVSRVVEAIEYEQNIPSEQKRQIEVETYHSFFWRILKAHGYLTGLPRRLSILAPSAEAIALSIIRLKHGIRGLNDDQKREKVAAENAERERLARLEGRICFDLYASLVGDLLHGSERIRKLIAAMHPVVILDEFQDTNDAQWRVVQALGQCCTLFALADPEQRIFGWLGASPERLDQFRDKFKPSEVDLSIDNHRSAGTDIALFGNHILTGKFQSTPYVGITVEPYPPNANQAFSRLVTTAYQARNRLVGAGRKDWSLAILVPTKEMTRMASDALRAPPGGLTAVPHAAVIEMEAAILSAEIIALLMEPDSDGRHLEQFIVLIGNYYQGKGGDEPTAGALTEAANIRKAYDEYRACRAVGKALRKNSILVAMLAAYDVARKQEMTGNPDRDWQEIRRILENGACKRLREIADEVRNIRVLDRGAQLRQELSQNWRDNGSYLNALTITRQAFVREHFATNAKSETGVVVMNMHKAKGKQFDEVIIFEGWPIKRKGLPPFNSHRIVRYNALDNVDDQARQNLRVSVTRAKRHTTILTPMNDPSVLLLK
jgi:DNA helicase-2/ATP-dependent DNA helicase PcrA